MFIQARNNEYKYNNVLNNELVLEKHRKCCFQVICCRFLDGQFKISTTLNRRRFFFHKRTIKRNIAILNPETKTECRFVPSSSPAACVLKWSAVDHCASKQRTCVKRAEFINYSFYDLGFWRVPFPALDSLYRRDLVCPADDNGTSPRCGGGHATEKTGPTPSSHQELASQ